MTRADDPRIRPAPAIEALEALKGEAGDLRALYRGGSGSRESWKGRVQAVVDRSLGTESDLAQKLRDNHYSLMMVTTATPDSAFADAWISGAERALGYIDAAIFELELVQNTTLATASSGAESHGLRQAANNRAVWVIHGRDQRIRDAMFDFLRAIGLLPTEWSQAVRATGRPTPYVGEALKVAFETAQAVVVLMTPDDEARLREQFRGPAEPEHERMLTPQARPNVLFEAGMAMAWNEDRTVLVEVGACRPFSDIGGRHVLRLDSSSQRRQELAQRLASAGCAVDTSGTDWHSAGDFTARRPAS